MQMEYTEEQKADIQSQIEKAVAEATNGLITQEQLNEVLSKRIKEVNDKHSKDLEEKEKVAKMSADEKTKHELEQLQAQLKERDDIISKKEHKEKLSSLMAEKNIKPEFYGLFANADLDKVGEIMDSFNSSISATANAVVDSKIQPTIPQHNNTQPKDAFEEGFDEN